jgi:hypothetical protein
MIQQTIERRDKNMEKKEERRFTEAELEQCRKVLEDRGYTSSLDLDDSDYGEPDSIVIVTEEDILKGEI